MSPSHESLAPLIAVIGCDGSGKSTISQEVLAWVRHWGPAEAAHLGKQSGNLGRSIARLPLVGTLLDRLITRKADVAREQRDKKAPNLITALVIVAFSLRRLFRFRRMLARRRDGAIIVTDRYPQLDLPGAYDGTGLSAAAPGNAFVRWLARRELTVFRWMTSYRPDLVIRLNVDLDTACARKPDHRRELLATKVAATPRLTFGGAPIVDLDGTRPLAEVSAAARAAVSRLLVERGYAAPADRGSAPGQ